MAPITAAVGEPATAIVSHEALAASIREHRGALLAIALRLCRDTDAAQELVQDTIVRALAKRHLLKPCQPIRAWLTTILRNGFIDALRRRKSTVQSFDTLTPTEVAWETLPEPAPLWSQVTGADHLWAVQQLDEEHRRTYGAVVLEHREIEAVARELGVKAATIRTRVHRARKELRLHLVALIAARKQEVA